jgi:ATP-dependent exoDNAse (exonuclease V) alpha subunit
VKKVTWQNIRYKFNEAANSIEEETLGSFTQYPIRLAWAVTIHKSQGLTFQRAVIDAGNAFAAGQVYVALSRCVSLDGIVLLSSIPAT